MALYAFDGTWNDSSRSDRDTTCDTNVHRFCKLYKSTTYYVDGVGSRGGLYGRVVGGATGRGARKRVREQLENLKKAFRTDGDQVVDVIGYSRGAAIARLFVHQLEKVFRKIQDSSGAPLTRPPIVRFLGLFDSVASFGVPWTDDRGFPKNIPECVSHTFHAMALDETRETFGIERCLGDPSKIAEVWFRGGHGDIGGNGTYVDNDSVEVPNLRRSFISLNWMLTKARACSLPVGASLELSDAVAGSTQAAITARSGMMNIGQAGTLSRRIHIGDLVHHSIELTELTEGIDGRQLRRIGVATRIEDRFLEREADSPVFKPDDRDIELAAGQEESPSSPSIVQLSTRRYPFDVLPARTWQSWLDQWGLNNVEPPVLDVSRTREFWSPTSADRALAWDVYVELITRVAVNAVDEGSGNSRALLESIVRLFGVSRESMKRHGVKSANAAVLITSFLNKRIRDFTSRWHLDAEAIDEDAQAFDEGKRNAFRAEFANGPRSNLRLLAKSLSTVAGVKLQLIDEQVA